jgi:hypothetical protein
MILIAIVVDCLLASGDAAVVVDDAKAAGLKFGIQVD